MLDSYVRPFIDLPLNAVGKRIAAYNISPNTITLSGFGMGVFSIGLIFLDCTNFALFFICLNRLLDGLDGAVARHSHVTDFGGFLDIVCDFIIYAGIVFAFGFTHSENLPYALFLVFSFIGPITSFLGYAILAAKRQISCDRRGKKSFYYLGGICEGTETTFVLLLFCIIPQYFQAICLIYGFLCWITTVGRVYAAFTDFGENTYTKQAEETKSQAL